MTQSSFNYWTWELAVDSLTYVCISIPCPYTILVLEDPGLKREAPALNVLLGVLSILKYPKWVRDEQKLLHPVPSSSKLDVEFSTPEPFFALYS